MVLNGFLHIIFINSHTRQVGGGRVFHCTLFKQEAGANPPHLVKWVGKKIKKKFSWLLSQHFTRKMFYPLTECPILFGFSLWRGENSIIFTCAMREEESIGLDAYQLIHNQFWCFGKQPLCVVSYCQVHCQVWQLHFHENWNTGRCV